MDEPKKLPAILQSMILSKERTDLFVEWILKNVPFLLSWSYRGLKNGEIVWEKNREKMKKSHTLESRTEEGETAYGLDGFLEVLNEIGEIVKISAIVKWFPVAGSSVKLNTVTSFHEDRKLDIDFLKQIVKEEFGNFWLILGAEGTPDNPKKIRVIHLGSLPIECFSLDSSVHSRNDLYVRFSQTSWVGVEQMVTCFDSWRFSNWKEQFKEIQRRVQ